MLKTYHRGAYGSKKLEEWSCCGYCGMNQEGCFSVSDDSMVHPRRPTRKRSNTDELSKTITQAGAKLELGLIYLGMHLWHIARSLTVLICLSYYII